MTCALEAVWVLWRLRPFERTPAAPGGSRGWRPRDQTGPHNDGKRPGTPATTARRCHNGSEKQFGTGAQNACHRRFPASRGSSALSGHHHAPPKENRVPTPPDPIPPMQQPLSNHRQEGGFRECPPPLLVVFFTGRLSCESRPRKRFQVDEAPDDHSGEDRPAIGRRQPWDVSPQNHFGIECKLTGETNARAHVKFAAPAHGSARYNRQAFFQLDWLGYKLVAVLVQAQRVEALQGEQRGCTLRPRGTLPRALCTEPPPAELRVLGRWSPGEPSELPFVPMIQMRLVLYQKLHRDLGSKQEGYLGVEF